MRMALGESWAPLPVIADWSEYTDIGVQFMLTYHILYEILTIVSPEQVDIYFVCSFGTEFTSQQSERFSIHPGTITVTKYAALGKNWTAPFSSESPSLVENFWKRYILFYGELFFNFIINQRWSATIKQLQETSNGAKRQIFSNKRRALWSK